jgi:hypothetical protein
MDTVHNAITEPVRWLEVFTGAGRRRKWSDGDKARIVAEIVTSGDSVCAVARRLGLSPQQMFGCHTDRNNWNAVGKNGWVGLVYLNAGVRSTNMGQRRSCSPLRLDDSNGKLDTV